MSLYRRFELIEEPSFFFPSLALRESSIFAPKALTLPSFVEDDLDVGFVLDVIRPSYPIEVFRNVTDLIRIDHTPRFSACKRIERVERLGTEFYLQSLSDRVSELESRFDRLIGSNMKGGERKYTWTAEIKGPEKNGFDRKYKWVAEIKPKEDPKKKEEKKGGVEKNYKWTADIKGKGADGAISRTYTIKASDAVESTRLGKKEKEKKEEKKQCTREKKQVRETRVVEIEEPSDNGAVVLRQVW